MRVPWVMNASIEERFKSIAGTDGIERQTALIPTGFFIWSAAASILGSLFLKTQGRDRDAVFVGQWAPTFLLLAVVSKLAKRFGDD